MALKFNIDESDRFFTNADKIIVFQVKQVDEVTAQAIGGWALSWMLKRRATDADASALITKTTGAGTVTITDGPNGVCQIAVTDENTAAITAGFYVHELKRTDVGSETPLCEGTVVLRQSKHIS